MPHPEGWLGPVVLRLRFRASSRVMFAGLGSAAAGVAKRKSRCVAPQRDFLLATPAAADPSPANITRDEALNLSRKTTGPNHPSGWGIAAGGNAAGGVPTRNNPGER